ncbi:hypothetical protein [Streptomyces sp. NPDC005077]|uniref:hypothetical protein n=1 Tax=Streptomyces sp. NPDC005077 TaxID=3154292 RepID=UPI0033BF2FE1
MPIGALGGGALAACWSNVPVLLGAATVALLAAGCLWFPTRRTPGTPQGPLRNGP